MTSSDNSLNDEMCVKTVLPHWLQQPRRQPPPISTTTSHPRPPTALLPIFIITTTGGGGGWWWPEHRSPLHFEGPMLRAPHKIHYALQLSIRRCKPPPITIRILRISNTGNKEGNAPTKSKTQLVSSDVVGPANSCVMNKSMLLLNKNDQRRSDGT